MGCTGPRAFALYLAQLLRTCSRRNDPLWTSLFLAPLELISPLEVGVGRQGYGAWRDYK